jgi:HAD superfamily hydrolase (TIGR01490 family)
MQAAFFDLDNTLVRGSSLFHTGRALVRIGLVARRDLLRFAVSEFRYVRTRTEISGGAQGLADRLLYLIEGKSTGEVTAHCRQAVQDTISQVLVPHMVDCVRLHQQRGDRTYLVTASPAEIAGPVAELLGMDGCVATRLQARDGRYTGLLAGPVVHGARKADQVAELAMWEGLRLSHCFAYSDSINDLPLLSRVRYPVVVNGNARVRRIAHARGWAIVDTARADRTSWPYPPLGSSDQRVTEPTVEAAA